MDSCNPNFFFDLKDFLHKALFKEGSFVWEALKEIVPYLESQNLGAIEGEVSPQAYLINREKISIGHGTIIEAGAYIQGPCIIGKNCHIRHGAYLRGGVIAGEGCVIGHATEVKNSILLNGASGAHFNYIGDSILGNRVNLGAGVKLANTRHDGREIWARLGEKKVATGLKKIGAIVGDGSKLGCNAVTNPGALLEPGCVVAPCEVVTGYRK